MTPPAITVLLLTLAAGNLQGQRHRVEFLYDDHMPARLSRSEEAGSLEQVPTILAMQMARLNAAGFLEASIDACATEGRSTQCTVTTGRQYLWARLSGAGIPPEIASEARFREKLHAGKPISPREVGTILEFLLVHCEENGYPFATVRLDSIREDEDGLHATVMLERGPLVRIDSVVVKGNARTNMRYLLSYIGIRNGDTYKESLIRTAERRVRELPFVTQRERPYVQFTPGLTKLYLFLDDKKASSINGILGVQPDPVDGNVTITGDLDLRLRNALRRGEAIELQWRKLQDQTQDLRVRFNLPNIVNTPFGLDANLKLFKRDTTFLEVAARVGSDFLLVGGDKVSLFLNTKNSDRLGSNLVTQPGLADVNILSYGIGIDRERFDYRFNPRRGHALQMEGSAGRKRTSQAVYIPPGSDAQPVPEVRTIQYELVGRAIAHLPVRQQGTFRLQVQGGWMVNDDLHVNELYRIGGLRTMRGVDEQSIFASAYAVGTIEYRFLFEENSNFFMFVDQGWWADDSKDESLTDSPLGFGAGATFETKAGLFSITYALARQFDNPVLLRGGKVHFGFISLF